VSTDGQKAIAAYRIEGQQLFFPNAVNGVAGAKSG
jgi:ABC-type tungstate transport system permease subunit